MKFKKIKIVTGCQTSSKKPCNLFLEYNACFDQASDPWIYYYRIFLTDGIPGYVSLMCLTLNMADQRDTPASLFFVVNRPYITRRFLSQYICF